MFPLATSGTYALRCQKMNRPQYRQAGQIVRDVVPRASLRGSRSDQLYATLLLVAGLAIRFGGGFIPYDFALGLSPTLFWWTLNSLSIGLWMCGSYFYARALRLQPVWALLGFLSVVGLILMFIVSRSLKKTDRYRP